MNLEAGLGTLDPAFARDQASGWMTAQVFNGLVELDADLLVKPVIAKDWRIEEEGKLYTFILRKDVFFHKHVLLGKDSSRTVTAADFVYSFSRICDPKTASSGQWIFNGKIEGLEAFKEGKADRITGFVAVDDTTLQIRLTRPLPGFLGLLAMPYAYVVPKEVVEAYGDEFRANPIGTGPFKFVRWEEGSFLLLHKNRTYFEFDNEVRLPYLEGVFVEFIPSRLSAFVEFSQGGLDIINGVDNSYKDEVLNLDGSIKEEYANAYQFVLAPQLNTEYLGILVDTTEEVAKGHPLSDVRVRKALNYAIDREKMVKYLLNGMGFPVNAGFVPKGMPSHNPAVVRGFEYDLDTAKALLRAAGYPNGEGLPELVLNSTPNYQHISEYVQKAFANIGVKLSIQNLQGGALRREIYSTKINFWRASWIADYPDAENYLSLFYSANHSPGGPNTTHYRSQAFDDLYDASLTMTDDSARFALYNQMEQIMLEDAPIIPLYYDRMFRMIQPNVKGFRTNPMNHVVLKYVRKE